MNITIRHSIFLSAACLSALFLGTSCDDVMNDGKEPETTSCSITGFAQKGQLAKGSRVTAFAMDSDLVATGESFPANISDDRGAFSVSGKTTAPYLELRADGYYFNEITGEMSSAPLYLESFVESSDTRANINLLTTAIKLRVMRLIKEGRTIRDANAQAQKELLTSFGMDLQASDFGEMDITGSSESDAVLLACACVMQQGRDAGGVSTLVQEIASDLEPDGTVSEDNVRKVLSNAGDVDVFKVYENIARFYSSKGIEGAAPAFYRLFGDRYDKDFLLQDNTMYALQEPWRGYSGEWRILSTTEFSVDIECDWVAVDMHQVLGPYYRVAYTVLDNSTAQSRTGTVSFKDKKGNVLDRISFFQEGHVTRLYLRFGGNTKAGLSTDAPRVGDKVLINRTETEVTGLEGDCAVVAVEPAPFYRVSWPADNMGYDDNPAYVVRTFPYEVGPDVKTQYYGARSSIEGSVLSGNISIDMTMCTAVMTFSTQNYPDAACAVLKGGSSDDCLSGTVTYVWNRNDLYLDPSLVEFYSFKDRSREVKVTGLSAAGQNYVHVLPQELENGMSVTLYDSAGKVLVEKQSSRSITCERGYLMSLGAI